MPRSTRFTPRDVPALPSSQPPIIYDEEAFVDAKELTLKQAIFVMEYLVAFNGKQAAINAGYAPSCADNAASRMLSLPHVQDALREQLKAKVSRIKLNADRLLLEVSHMATVSSKDLYDENGELIPITNLPDHVARCVKSIEIEELFEGRGESREPVGRLKKIHLHSKIRAIELAAKLTGAFLPEQHEHLMKGLFMHKHQHEHAVDISGLPRKDLESLRDILMHASGGKSKDEG